MNEWSNKAFVGPPETDILAWIWSCGCARQQKRVHYDQAGLRSIGFERITDLCNRFAALVAFRTALYSIFWCMYIYGPKVAPWNHSLKGSQK